MSTVTAGNPIVLDALFGQGGQPSPDYVEFTVQLPDGETTVVFATGDPEVTNPSGDYWECAVGVPTENGEYRWQAVGQAASEVAGTVYGTVFVIPSALAPVPPSEPPGPQLGPCETWITGEDVADCTTFDYGSSPAVFDVAAYEASMALFEISGRQFSGLCERIVRPCNDDCNCWGAPVSSGLTPFLWSGVGWGADVGGWAWTNERGVRRGCNAASVVRLGGYPVRVIDRVLIGGQELPEFDPVTGARNWRLDDWRDLVRMDIPAVAPSTVATPQFWPGCQNRSLDANQPGTFEVTYRWGVDPPPGGRGAAVELATQIFLACGGGAACVLPQGITRVVRQGLEVERFLLADWLDPKKPTGLVQVDLFLQSYCGGVRSGRRPAVWSPDVQQFARPVGTHPSGS